MHIQCYLGNEPGWVCGCLGQKVWDTQNWLGVQSFGEEKPVLILSANRALSLAQMSLLFLGSRGAIVEATSLRASRGEDESTLLPGEKEVPRRDASELRGGLWK